MRCGILIVGSLLWDDGEAGQRAGWRAARLETGAGMHVRAPIHYGRKSRGWGYAYTMALKADGSSGQGVLVPCVNKVQSIENLAEEAQALWQAEDPNAEPGMLHKSWGCVGALFGPDTSHQALAADWTAHFQAVKTRCVSVVNAEGLLEIDWPNGPDGQPADFDVILATVTKPEAEPPTPRAVADAWISQNDEYERYFFNNVKHGIRTPDDLDIWRRIEERAPRWIKAESYREAIDTLRAETAACTP